MDIFNMTVLRATISDSTGWLCIILKAGFGSEAAVTRLNLKVGFLDSSRSISQREPFDSANYRPSQVSICL